MSRLFVVTSLIFLFVGCNADLGPSNEVALSDSELDVYITEMNRRLGLWYGDEPFNAAELKQNITSEVTFLAEPQTDHPFCYFSPRGNVIVFDPQYKDSGCMPHEIGHYALRKQGHPGWCSFEHPGERGRNCS